MGYSKIEEEILDEIKHWEHERGNAIADNDWKMIYADGITVGLRIALKITRRHKKDKEKRK